jgi:hypothetical protein
VAIFNLVFALMERLEVSEKEGLLRQLINSIQESQKDKVEQKIKLYVCLFKYAKNSCDRLFDMFNIVPTGNILRFDILTALIVFALKCDEFKKISILLADPHKFIPSNPVDKCRKVYLLLKSSYASIKDK